MFLKNSIRVVLNYLAKEVVFVFLLLLAGDSYSQHIAIDTTGAISDTSAILDLQSVTRGFLLPRMTTANMNAIAAPATSLIVFNNTTNCYMFYNGAAWQQIVCVCTSAPATPSAPVQSPAGNVCTSSGIYTYSVIAVAGITYSWTVPSGGTITSGQGTNSITVTYAASSSSGLVTITALNSCGMSTPSSLFVSIFSPPSTPGAIQGVATVCSSSASEYYYISPVSNATSYTWTVPAGSTVTSGATTNAITVTFGATSGNITVAANNACGSSAVSSLPVTVTSGVPAAPTTITATNPNPNMYSKGNVYTCSVVAGVSSYYWTVAPAAPQSCIVSGQGTTSISVNYSAVLCGTTYTITVYATNSCGKSVAKTLNVTPQSHGTVIFNYVGPEYQTWKVPSCATTTATVQLWGAGGGGGSPSPGSAGGTGGYVTGTLTVAPNNNIYIYVGGGGSNTGTGGFAGGGNGAIGAGFNGGGGGGRSAVQTSLGTDAVTAGGGGGGAYSQTGYYGNGGGGSDGVSPSGNGDPSNQCSSDYGSGGTSVAGGAGGSDVTVCSAGTNAYNGGNGASLAGGNSSNTLAEYSGGGGGGYYGGGAGANFYGSGGGGGSSYVTGASFTVTTNTQGNTPSNGTNYTTPFMPPNSADPNYITGTGTSQSGTNGGNGEVIIIF
jgi:PKD-like domain/Glycine rich protein